MCGYSLFADCSFDKKNNKLDYYRGKDSLKRFCQDLKKQAKSRIEFKKKDMPELTKDEQYKHDTEKNTLYLKNHFMKMLKIIILK